MSEHITGVGLYRPVLNIEQGHIDDMHSLAREHDFSKLHLARSLSFSLLSSGDISYFYQQAGYEPEEIELEDLSEYFEHCRPDTANQEIRVPTWPATAVEYDSRSLHSRRRLTEVAYLGSSACVAALERQEYKHAVAEFGDRYGPIDSTWPADDVVGLGLGHVQRSHHDRSELRRYVRLLRNAHILPEVLKLGGVEPRLETLQAAG